MSEPVMYSFFGSILSVIKGYRVPVLKAVPECFLNSNQRAEKISESFQDAPGLNLRILPKDLFEELRRYREGTLNKSQGGTI
ncbi:MAG: hypothetical protein FWH53_00705 [Leptospirales bacterium]|nr:hypothetical protein [Leptospirales bacterium]